jgi:threonine/homoserine/homoserine lactone efflux protein
MGLGALLAASETAFTMAKVIGAAYLIWLGIKTFRSTRLPFDPAAGEARPAPLLLPAGACWSAPATRRPCCSSRPSSRSS